MVTDLLYCIVVTLSACICLELASKRHPFPCPTSYRTALTYYVDITSTPRTHVLKELIDYAQDEKDKEFLQKMTDSSEETLYLFHLEHSQSIL